MNVREEVNIANARIQRQNKLEVVLNGFFDLIDVAVLISNAGIILRVLYS